MIIIPRWDRAVYGKYDWLYYLCNSFDNDLEVLHNYKKKDGSLGWSRFIKFLRVQEYDNYEIIKELGFPMTKYAFMQNISHRTVLKPEFMLDCDNLWIPMPDDTRFYFPSIKAKSTWIVKDLLSQGINPSVYWTQSKSYHISWVDTDLLKYSDYTRTQKKKKIIWKYGCDGMKAGLRAPIALEWSLHYKSKKPKIPVKLV